MIFYSLLFQGKEFHNNEEKAKLSLNTLPFQGNAKPWIAPCKGIQDSLGIWIQRRGFSLSRY